MAAYDRWAAYYDIIHQGLPGEAEFYVGQATRKGGTALELGCGTGRIAIPMAMSGVNVVGLDNSKPMLDRCRVKKRAIGKTPGTLKLVHADMTDFDLGTAFDFIAMPYRTVMHLLTQDEQRRCLRTVRRHLKTDGVFALNLWVPNLLGSACRMGGAGGGFRFAGRYSMEGLPHSIVHYCSSGYDEFRQLLIEEHLIHEVDRNGAIVRTVTLPMLRTWITPREMGNLVRLCGYAVDGLFGDFDCNPLDASSTEMVWVLKRGPEPMA